MIEEERVIPYRTRSLTGVPVLVVAPHPDDETIGCGGSITAHAEAGDPVHVLFVTRGEQGDFSNRYGSGYPALREAEARNAVRVLGVDRVSFLSLRDREVRADDGLIREVARHAAASGARLLYAPSPWEAHPDHRQTSLAVWEFCKTAGRPVTAAFYETSAPLRCNTLVDITPAMSRKLEALRCYASQLAETDWTDRVQCLNRFRTITLLGRAEYAEAFRVEECVPERPNPFERIFRDVLEDTGPWVESRPPEPSRGKRCRLPWPGGSIELRFVRK